MYKQHYSQTISIVAQKFINPALKKARKGGMISNVQTKLWMNNIHYKYYFKKGSKKTHHFKCAHKIIHEKYP